MYCLSFKILNFNLLLSEENGQLKQVSFCKKQTVKNTETPLLKNTKKQLEEYFLGKRKEFNLPFELNGTPFQKQVWAELLKIPYGKTVTYGELAKQLGKPNAARAVGNALNKNPIAVIVSCHRVIAANNKPGGYACGIKIKKFLLGLEQKI